MYSLCLYQIYCSVQFHPEHTPGPEDLECLFDVFLEEVKAHAQSWGRGSGVKMSDRINDCLIYRPASGVTLPTPDKPPKKVKTHLIIFK